MSGTPGIPFSKPWLSCADQVQLLQQRGLTVADPQAAEQFLSHLNYYRFSGYCLAFELQRHAFNGSVDQSGQRLKQTLDFSSSGIAGFVTRSFTGLEVSTRRGVCRAR